MPQDQVPVPQFAVIHTPGPTWQKGVPFMQQSGVEDHAGYWGKFYETGKVAFGGPFLDATAGGCMVIAHGVDHEAAEAMADADPGFRSGLLKFEIRPWLLAFAPRGK